MAFQLYEHEDMLGLVIDEHVLLRTLKVRLIKTTFSCLLARIGH